MHLSTKAQKKRRNPMMKTAEAHSQKNMKILIWEKTWK